MWFLGIVRPRKGSAKFWQTRVQYGRYFSYSNRHAIIERLIRCLIGVVESDGSKRALPADFITRPRTVKPRKSRFVRREPLLEQATYSVVGMTIPIVLSREEQGAHIRPEVPTP